MQCPVLTYASQYVLFLKYDKPTKDHQTHKENLHRERWSKKFKDERKEERKLQNYLNINIFRYIRENIVSKKQEQNVMKKEQQ